MKLKTLLAGALAIWLSAGRMSLADVSRATVALGKQATAYVETESGSGSAFCIASNGYFVTNAHVVGASSTVKIVLNAGEKTQRVMIARVIRSDRTRDLAILKTGEPVPVPVLTLGDVSGLYETEPLATFGFPFGTDLAEGKEQYPVMTISTGKITALRREKGDLQDIQFDASVNPGNSGGPVLDESGRVIGIVEAGIPGAALNFAIPVEKLRAMLSEPDIVFTPPRITADHLHRPAKFRIEVSDYSGRTLGFTVSLTLTQDNGTSQTFGAQPDGAGMFVVSAVPVPDLQTSVVTPPTIRYRVTVTDARQKVAEAAGTLTVETTLRPAAALPPHINPMEATAPGVTLPAIHPPQIPDKSIIDLPAQIDDVAVGGGGRYLVLSMKSLQKIAVFDCNIGRIVHYISVESSDYHFAAGARVLVIVLDDRKTIERWDLERFTRTLVVSEPAWASVREMRMGSGSNGPVVLGLSDGSTKWINAVTLTPYEPNTQGSPYGWGGTDQFPFTFRLSADGTVMVGWMEGLSPRTVVTAVFQGNHTIFHAASVDGYVGRYYTPGSDDTLIYTSAGIDTLTMDPLNPEEFGHTACLPVQGGSFFLTSDGPSFALYTSTDKRLLLTLPELEELRGHSWNIEKQIYLVPAANLLITIPSARDQVVVRRFDLVTQLNRMAVDYLFVSSVPPAAYRPGESYVYQLDVRSRHGGVRYALDSGPSGMTLSKTGRLLWAVPRGYTNSEEHIIIRITDASGQEIYHTFRIAADR